MTPKVGWTKWKNPYAVEEEEDKYEEECELEEYEEEENRDGPPNHQMRVIITPNCAIPLPEHSSPQKVFNLWMAHTNFNISRNILDIVQEVDGVETLDVFSRYRMRIGIGKMFDTQETIGRINNKIYQSLSGIK